MSAPGSPGQSENGQIQIGEDRRTEPSQFRISVRSSSEPKYQTGQENQLGALGLMVNIIVLWQTVYTQHALDHLADHGYPIDPADVARLSPLGHETINLKGRYRTTTKPPIQGLRPLRTNQ